METSIQLGPFWNRTVFDPRARVVRRRWKTLYRFDEIRAVRVREVIGFTEEIQFMNMHPAVQKEPRGARLWLDATRGGSRCVAEADRAGVLLDQAAAIAKELGVPLITERVSIEAAEA